MINQWLNWNTIKRFILNSDDIGLKPRLATTGWVDGSVVSTERPNYIRVRFTDDKSQLEVYNDGVPSASGIQIQVYKGPDGVWRARYPSKSYYLVDLAFSFIKNHANNHDYYDVDPVLISVRNMMSLHPYVSAKWSVRVRPGWVVFGRRPYWFAGETVTVLSLRPASGARFVLLSAALDIVDGVDTVKIIVTAGESKPVLVSPADFPDIPAGNFPVCAVQVRSDKRKLVDKLAHGDIYDLRLSGGGPGGPGSYHSEPLCYGGEILFFNSDVIIMEVHN